MSAHRQLRWMHHHVGLLTRLWHEGKSGREIAQILGPAFTIPKVFAKARSLGLPSRYGSTGGRSGQPAAKRANPLYPWAVTANQPMPKDPPEPEGARRVSLAVLREGECKFPLGDPKRAGFGFCGLAIAEGAEPNVYCAFHRGIAYRPLPPRSVSHYRSKS